MENEDTHHVTLDALPPVLRAHVTAALKGARQSLAERGEVRPVILLFGDHEPVIIDAAAETGADKDRVAFMTRELVQIHDAHTVLLISEIWSLPEDMPAERVKELLAKYHTPGGCPQRIEQVMVQAETRDGKRYVLRATIQRKGRAVTLATPTILDLTGMQMGGRYVGWFAPEQPTPGLD
jgi:hypothetical protein